MGRASFTEEAIAPDTPSGGFVTLYFLASGSGIPLVKDDAGVVQTVALLEAANVFTVAQKIDVASTTALVVEDDGVEDDTLVVNTSSGNIGVGTSSPGSKLHIADGTSGEQLRMSRGTGLVRFVQGNNLDDITLFNNDAGVTMMFWEGSSGNVGIGTSSTSAMLRVDQFSGTGAIPVLYLDQGDDSEEMIEFAGTIGVGNAIEAVGAKTLTVTHFIKITLPGALTRYLEVGTIAA